jgi:hypothetical protein
MDIFFHYYAVKIIARVAGFSIADAEMIAKYSQYVDDYNPTVLDRRYLNMPGWVEDKKMSNLLIKDGAICNFRPMPTGFNDKIDMLVAMDEDFQKNTISSFHFIPQSKAKIDAGDRRTYPAKISGGGDGSIISILLQDAKTNFKSSKTEDEKIRALMYIGMLLHIFADTYAHQGFTGFNEPANIVTILNIKNNATNKDFGFWDKSNLEMLLNWYSKLPLLYNRAIQTGHSLAGHLPDLSHVKYILKYTNPASGTEKIQERDNTAIYMDAAKEMFRYLSECVGKIHHESTMGILVSDLKEMFLESGRIQSTYFHYNLYEHLKKMWTKKFKKYEEGPHPLFIYKKEEIFNNVPYTGEMEEDFYYYNSYAEDIPIKVYGSNSAEKAEKIIS